MAQADQKSVPITETPEFKAAVALAAKSAVEQMQAELLASLKQPAPSGDASASGLMAELAMHIATLNEQGGGRKRVSPEVLAERAKAHEQAISLILEARKRGLKPEYQLVAKVYLNERMVEPFRMDSATKRPIPTQIVWSGMPSEAMRPLNAVARDIYKAFKASIGSKTDIQKRLDKPLWMTSGGLVVAGDPPRRREVAAAHAFDDDLNVSGDRKPAEPNEFADDLDVKNPHDPTAPFVHVLGSVAPPARQNYAENNAAKV